MFEACEGRNWYRRDFWLTPTSVCDWYGVGCSTEGSVVLVNLHQNNLACNVPPSLFHLASLEKLNLGSNRITVDFSKLSEAHRTQLLELRLSNTQVSSLAGIERLDGLTVLDVSFSNLTGSFPVDALKSLSNLRVLSLSGNGLTGPISQGTSSQTSSSSLFGERSYLRILRLDQNKFSGPLPSFSEMETLTHVSLSDNRFNGTIPSDFLLARSADSSDLSLTIDLSDNRLEGTVPEELARFANASLLLAGNRLESLPPALCSRTAEWNGGDVGKYGCDGLLCPPHTYSKTGRRRSSSRGDVEECRPCPSFPSHQVGVNDANDPAPSYLGQRTCPGVAATSGSSPGFRSKFSVGFVTSAAAAAAAVTWIMTTAILC
jgi:hypothetical protein